MNLDNNFFSVFGLPVKYDVDVSELTHRYRDLQKQLHPDKFANSSGSERAMSVQKASLVNDAYNVLKNPLLRARYILELQGVLLNDETNTIMDPAFLMQQMELRESLEAIRLSTDPLLSLDSLAEKIDSQTSALKANLNSLFSRDTHDYEAIAAIIRKLQFFVRLREEVDSQYEKYEQ